MAAVRHLGFLGIQILTAYTVLKVNIYHSAVFRADRSNRCRDMAVLRLFNMATSAILDF